MPDQVEAEAGPLALGADGRIGQPDRRDEIAPGELREHPGVDLVGLGGERGEGPRPRGVGHLDVPAGQLELIVHEPAARHGLHDTRHRLAVQRDPARKQPEPVAGCGHPGRGHRLPGLVEHVDAHLPAGQIQSGVQHRWASWLALVPTRTHFAARGLASWQSVDRGRTAPGAGVDRTARHHGPRVWAAVPTSVDWAMSSRLPRRRPSRYSSGRDTGGGKASWSQRTARTAEARWSRTGASATRAGETCP